MPLYTLLCIVNRIPCSALRTKDEDSRADANGLLPIPSVPKTKRLEGPSAAEVFRHLMSLDLYRYAVQALNFFPGKPLLALLLRHNHPLQPRLGFIATRPVVIDDDAQPPDWNI